MSFKEQFLTKNYNEEELMKGYVNNMPYEEYIYYLASLSEFFKDKRKYQHAMYFFDHLLKSVGCHTLLRQYYQLGKKIPKELEFYNVDLEEFTGSELTEKLNKKINRISYVHTNRRLMFQLLFILIGTGLFFLLHFLFSVDSNTSLIIAFVVGAFAPLLYNPKPITMDTKKIEKQLLFVTRYDSNLLEYVQNKVRKDKNALNAIRTQEEKEDNEEKE